LSKDPIPNIKYPDVVKYFEGKSPSIKDVRNAIIKIRKSKLVYPTQDIGTVGSFFKNPIIPITSYQLLVTSYPDIKGRDAGKGLIKIYAGQLIEKSGWKGKKFKNVGISEKHALVLVSYKGAKAKNILELAKKIQVSVKAKFNISLKPEVRIVTSG
jgi:UDP-N-acetylmuramate dehydrogenase